MQLHFIALLPPPELRAAIRAFKEYAKIHFNSGWALRSPAHITLIPPFRMSEAEVEGLSSVLAAFARNQKPFEVHLNGFAAFPPRVIFVNPMPNPELERCQSALQASFEQFTGEALNLTYGFHPHVTVAFKDLSKAQFEPAWQYFSGQSFQAAFQVHSLSFLKHRDGEWHILNEFPFD